MSFIALLLALLLEQARPPTASAGIDKLLFHWADWLRHTLDAGDKRHAWTAWGLAVGLPCALAVLVHWHLLLTAQPIQAVVQVEHLLFLMVMAGQAL